MLRVPKIKIGCMNTVDMTATQGLMDFIRKSPNGFFTVATASEMLDAAGFEQLQESKPYELKRGGKYYVARNSSALLAFVLPVGGEDAFSIISSHTDSPSFKIKENPEISSTGLYTTLNVEGYGGMLMAPWFDRPLGIAGRAFVKSEDGMKQVLVNIDRDLCTIVNLCIHQNRSANEGMEYKIQKDMLPIIGLGKHDGALRQLVAQSLGIEQQAIIDTELFLYNRQEPTFWGLENEFFSSPRIDDQQCLYCSLTALLALKESRTIPVVCMFDNEEVGSGTKQGAMGDFLSQNLKRIAQNLGWSYEQEAMAQAKSFMLSADNGHALHPNYTEFCDPTNKPVVNGGVLIKYAGNQKYTTDGYSASRLRSLLEAKNIPYQVFHNNSNVAGGSTLGNLSGHQYSIPTVDIGAAQLAMHSPYETGGTEDTRILTEAMVAFLEA